MLLHQQKGTEKDIFTKALSTIHNRKNLIYTSEGLLFIIVTFFMLACCVLLTGEVMKKVRVIIFVVIIPNLNSQTDDLFSRCSFQTEKKEHGPHFPLT